MKRAIGLLLLLTLPATAIYALKPAENATVNFSSVYFEDGFQAGAVLYQLCVYQDSMAAVNGATPTHTLHAKIPAFWLHQLDWGKKYYWLVKGIQKDVKTKTKGGLHVFQTQKIEYQSFDEIRMDVKKNTSAKHSGGYIALDYTRSVYDRDGKVVWTLPMIEGLLAPGTQVRDLKITKQNTFTFLTIPNAAEIDLSGNVIWQAPQPFVLNNDTIVYHHELQKTARGTYMVLGDKKVWRKIPSAVGNDGMKDEFEVKAQGNEIYKRVLIAILLEFDKEGKLIWSWDANDYLKDEDLNYKKTKRGFPNLSTHANAFSENQAGTKVYIGFRDLSRIIRVDKASKKVESSWGEKYPSGEAMYGHGLFRNQHDANVTTHNSIYIFNNNGSLSNEGVSSILELRENLKKTDSVLIWRFNLDFDTLSKGKSLNGGNVEELPNGNLLLCAGAMNRLFEVTKKKEVVWDAFMYARGKGDSSWQEMPQYRSHYVKDLKRPACLVQVLDPQTAGTGQKATLSLYNTGNCPEGFEIKGFSESGAQVFKMSSKTLQKGENLRQIHQWQGKERLKTLEIRALGSFEPEKVILW